jgi:hypothetical protein
MYRYAAYMQITGIGFCAIRGCENRAIEVVAVIALCRGHRDVLEHALKTPPKLFREVVYYAAWPLTDQVKIGTSIRLVSRMKNLSTEARGRVSLMVVEPGSKVVRSFCPGRPIGRRRCSGAYRAPPGDASPFLSSAGLPAFFQGRGSISGGHRVSRESR